MTGFSHSWVLEQIKNPFVENALSKQEFASGLGVITHITEHIIWKKNVGFRSAIIIYESPKRGGSS